VRQDAAGTMAAIPEIAVDGLFCNRSADRDRVDRQILAAATRVGFMTITLPAGDAALSIETRQRLLSIFGMEESEIRNLWRQKFDPAHRNVYRGWFPAQTGAATWKEGIDLGPDIVYGGNVVHASDPLREATPLPAERTLPGFRAAVADYYRAMERVARALMQSLARGLGLDEEFFEQAFHRGISTLRLLRYPSRPIAALTAPSSEGLWIVHQGERRHISGAPHVDSGLVTVLAQAGVSGLQARSASGEWIDVPPREGRLTVNFGKLLQRWTGNRIKATEHRVLGSAGERFSIPFFYEPRVDAEIAPLSEGDNFLPFLYGDYLWETITKFLEFRGLESLRPPHRTVARA
jgi:isopenicillin N synthase-like dioxygenase